VFQIDTRSAYPQQNRRGAAANDRPARPAAARQPESCTGIMIEGARRDPRDQPTRGPAHDRIIAQAVTIGSSKFSFFFCSEVGQ